PRDLHSFPTRRSSDLTCCGEMLLQVLPDNQVRVDMGVPELEPAKIPFTADGRSSTYTLEMDNQPLTISAVSMGNPHAVTVVDNRSEEHTSELQSRENL